MQGYGGANAHAIIESVDALLPGYRSSRQIERTKTAQNGSNGNGIILSSGSDINTTANGHANRHANGHANSNGNGVGQEHKHRSMYLLPFSAHDERTLKGNIDALQPSIKDYRLADLAYTLGARRSLFSHRTFRVVGLNTQNSCENAVVPVSKKMAVVPTLGFVFTGE